MIETYGGYQIIRKLNVAAIGKSGDDQYWFVVTRSSDGASLGRYTSVDAARRAIDRASAEPNSSPGDDYKPDPRD